MTPSTSITFRRPRENVVGSCNGFFPSSITCLPSTVCRCCPGQTSGRGSGTVDCTWCLWLALLLFHWIDGLAWSIDLPAWKRALFHLLQWQRTVHFQQYLTELGQIGWNQDTNKNVIVSYLNRLYLPICTNRQGMFETLIWWITVIFQYIKRCL